MNLLIRDLTEEQLEMFTQLAGLRIVRLIQQYNLIDLQILLAPENLVVMELEP